MPGDNISRKFLGWYIETINTEGRKYLVRTHLTPWKWWKLPFRIYIHKFYAPDSDRVFHDHPWWFRTIVLWGGYDEVSHEFEDVMVPHPGTVGYEPTGRIIHDKLRFLSYRWRYATHAHRITTLYGGNPITLIIRGTRDRNWGFWVPPVNYVDPTGQVIPSRINNRTPWWRWVYWRNYLDQPNPEVGEKY